MKEQVNNPICSFLPCPPSFAGMAKWEASWFVAPQCNRETALFLSKEVFSAGKLDSVIPVNQDQSTGLLLLKVKLDTLMRHISIFLFFFSEQAAVQDSDMGQTHDSIIWATVKHLDPNGSREIIFLGTTTLEKH